MIGNTPYDRDELLVTGIPPVADPLTTPLTEPPTETKPLTETEAAPVFVDVSGWRARLGRRLGLAAGALLVVFLGALGLGLTTGADVPLTPWSESSAHPRVKGSHPRVAPPKTTEKTESPAGGSAPTGQAAVPAPPATSRPSSSTPAPQTAPTTVATTSRPGRTQVSTPASPPAWGHKKKSR
ncbi:hypothetical protein [Actinomadura formosensis]|uniref:hypothetical protein n=1 Tax=Actinomadura formosensis TaxID=60706 RepID=UPI003D8C9C93